MPRIARQLALFGVPYHIVSRGNHQETIFTYREDYEKFLDLIAEAKEEFHFLLYHYALMPNHIHLMIHPEKDEDMKGIMQKIKQKYSVYIKRSTRMPGHLWEGRYYHQPILDESYLQNCGFYIELNPSRANLCVNPEDYEWSSYSHYAFGKKNPLIDDSPIYESFGVTAFDRQFEYRRIAHLWKQNPPIKVDERTEMMSLSTTRVSLGDSPQGTTVTDGNRLARAWSPVGARP